MASGVREVSMFRFYPAAIAIGLTSFCTAAYSDPQIIQPTQQFAFAGAGSGGVAINGSLILVGAPHGGESPATTGTVYLYRRDDHCSGTLCWKPAGQMVRPDAVPDDRFGAS